MVLYSKKHYGINETQKNILLILKNYLLNENNNQIPDKDNKSMNS